MVKVHECMTQTRARYHRRVACVRVKGLSHEHGTINLAGTPFPADYHTLANDHYYSIPISIRVIRQGAGDKKQPVALVMPTRQIEIAIHYDS